jgi:hypothetical protein
VGRHDRAGTARGDRPSSPSSIGPRRASVERPTKFELAVNLRTASGGDLSMTAPTAKSGLRKLEQSQTMRYFKEA